MEEAEERGPVVFACKPSVMGQGQSAGTGAGGCPCTLARLARLAGWLAARCWTHSLKLQRA